MADVDVLAAVAAETNERDALFGPYWTSPSVGYIVLQDSSSHIEVWKTSDSGASWAEQDSANNPGSSNNRSMAVYFDQETKGDTGTLIHIAWCQASDNEFHYIQFDTSDDTFGTDRTIDSITISGATTLSDMSVTKAKSGRVYVCGSGDMNFYTEGTSHSMLSSDTVDPADLFSAGNIDTETSPYSSDEEIVRLLPGSAADDDDIVAVVMDTINLDLEFWKYDRAPTPTWGKTTIDASISLTQAECRSYKRSFDAASRHSDEATLVAYWDDLDAAGASSFHTAEVTHATPTVTAKADLHGSTDDSFLAGILINQQTTPPEVYVAYVGEDGGAEFWGGFVKCYFKKSTDSMGSWGTEQAYGADFDDLKCVSSGHTVGNSGGRVMPAWFNDDLTDITINDGNDVEIAAATEGGFAHSQAVVI